EVQPPEAEEMEAAKADEAQHRMDGSGAGEPPRNPKKQQHVSRWVAVLLITVLVGVGYLERERLLKLIPTKPAKKAAPSDENAASGHKAELKVLYWQDPMNPAYKSDKPGKSPAGMDLVPVYENGAGQATANLPEGAFQISPEKQQLIGVQYGEAVYK